MAVWAVAAAAHSEDRAVALSWPDARVLVVADGAGGTSRGGEAAQAVIDCVRAMLPGDGRDWVEVLRDLDRRLHSTSSGQTTAVVACVAQGLVAGASVGDSEAWVLVGGRVLELTARQKRKPLLGTGAAVPVAFGPVAAGDRVLLGSDGLFKYVAPGRIAALAATSPLEQAAHDLVDAARLPSGRLQDDVAVVLAG